MYLGIVLIIAAAVGVGYYKNQLDKKQTAVANYIKLENAEAVRLSAIKSKYEAQQRQKAEYEQRVSVIQALQNAQAGPVKLLDMVSKTINSSDDVWLNQVKDEGANITVEGTGLSANAVANLMTEMMRTGYFKSVEIKETYQDDQVKNMQAFNFVLICERQQQQPKS